MKYFTEIQLNFKGGIVSPGDLLNILNTANSLGVTELRFGLRQQLIMQIPADKLGMFEKYCTQKTIDLEKGRNKKPNMVSSYATVNIFEQEGWLREGVYKDVFDLFSYKPRLKINICDSRQNLVPFFTGHLNWLSSAHQHFWHLYIRFPHTAETFYWPELIYTNDIARVSAKIEELILKERAGVKENGLVINTLVDLVRGSMNYIGKTAEEVLSFPPFHIPYYEGFNKDGSNYWLGIYRRNELFPLPFLMDVCNICLETRIGQFYTTPWKSIIVKGISSASRHLWDDVLGKYRINVRHAANELNWQIKDNDEDGLIIKRNIIRHFDKEDVRTYGLSFAVQTQPLPGMFGSVIIRKNENKRSNRLKSLDRFDILYTRDFNPNSNELILYRDSVEKDFIGTYLVSLCKYFYEQKNHKAAAHILQPVKQQLVAAEDDEWVYQCNHCLTVYDEAAGDAGNNIDPGIPFSELPDDYVCPLCDAPKKEFIAVSKKSLQLLVV